MYSVFALSIKGFLIRQIQKNVLTLTDEGRQSPDMFYFSVRRLFRSTGSFTGTRQGYSANNRRKKRINPPSLTVRKEIHDRNYVQTILYQLSYTRLVHVLINNSEITAHVLGGCLHRKSMGVTMILNRNDTSSFGQSSYSLAKYT